MGLVLFNILIHKVNAGKKSTIYIKSTDDIKVEGVVSILEERGRIQNGFDKLEKLSKMPRGNLVRRLQSPILWKRK